MGKTIGEFNGGVETPTMSDTDKMYKRDDAQSSTNAKDQFITWGTFKNVIKALFSSVAQTGSYNDLTNKPTIPSKISSLENDMGFVQQYVADYKPSARTANHGGSNGTLWLLCDGSAVLRNTYASLFAAIGTSFGAGDGSTTFNLPDFRGRVMGFVGQGSGLSNRALGNTVGTEAHTLTVSQLPTMTEHSGNYRYGMVRRNGLATVVASDSAPVDTEMNLTASDDFPGQNASHNNMQPTLFAGNMFIFSGVN